MKWSLKMKKIGSENEKEKYSLALSSMCCGPLSIITQNNKI